VALAGSRARLHFAGESPSFQINLQTLDGLRRQLACTPNVHEPLCETRYPFLDRDMVEFLCGVPCDQILRPNQRRSLMRRALAGLVPDEVLNRKRKAYLVRSPTKTMDREWQRLVEQRQFMVAESFGIVNQDRFTDAVQKAQAGMEIDVVSAQRTLALEVWLRQLAKHSLLTVPTTRANRVTEVETRCGVHAT